MAAAGISSLGRDFTSTYCLFRTNPAGTREGKVVVVQHCSNADPDTVKRHSS
jgi:hypothetical protein